jgi:hypothetical protein
MCGSLSQRSSTSTALHCPPGLLMGQNQRHLPILQVANWPALLHDRLYYIVCYIMVLATFLHCVVTFWSMQFQRLGDFPSANSVITNIMLSHERLHFYNTSL